MPARSLPNLGLQAFFDLGEDGWNDEMDNNMLRLSVLVQAGAIDKVAALPDTPTNGDIYILNEAAASNPNSLAFRDNGAWMYFAPQEGWLIYNKTVDQYESFNGTFWTVLQTSGGGGGGSGVLPYAGARVQRSTATVLSTTGVWTPIPWNVEGRDTLSLWDVAAPTRFTIPTGVTKVRLMSMLQVDASDLPSNHLFTFRKNGSEFFDGRAVWCFGNAGYSNPAGLGVSDVIDVVAGDYIEVVYFISSSLAITAQSFFSIEIVERNLSATTSLTFGIDELADVDASSPEDGEAIIYRQDTQDWGAGRPLVTANVSQGLNKPFKGAMAKFTANRLVEVSPTIVAWDSTDFDTDGYWSAANPSRLSIPVGTGISKVRLTATLTPTTTDLGSDHLYAVFRKNGTAAFRGNGSTGYEIGYTDVGVSLTSGVIPVVEGDYFEVYFNSPDTSRTWEEATCHFSIEVIEVADQLSIDASGISPVIKSSNIQGVSSNTFNVAIPPQTLEGDVVVIFGSSAWAINPVAGWITLHEIAATQTNGRVIAKRMTAADLSAGFVTITTAGTFNAVFSAVTIDGKSIDGISSIIPQQSATSTSSLPMNMPFASVGDRVLYFAAVRATSNVTFTNGTVVQSVNASSYSGAIAQSLVTSAFPQTTANFSTAGAYYAVSLNIKARSIYPDITQNTYNIPFGFTTRPSANEIMLLHVFPEAVKFERNWLGSRASIGTNSTGTMVFNVAKNTVPVGTITITPTGNVVFATLDTNPVTFNTGDVLSILAPAGLDASVANAVFTLRGTKLANTDGTTIAQLNRGGSRLLFSWNGATDAPFAISPPIALGDTRQLEVTFTDVSSTGACWRVAEFSFDGGITWEGNLGVNNYLSIAPTNGGVGAQGTGDDQSWFLHATSSNQSRSSSGTMLGLGVQGIKAFRSFRNPNGVHLNRNPPTHVRLRGWMSTTTQTDFISGTITVVGYN